MLEVLIQTLQRDFQFSNSSVAESPGISANCPGESLRGSETSLPLYPIHFSFTELCFVQFQL